MNIKIYLDHQMAEDRRAFVIHYPAKNGKTQFAIRISTSHPNIYYRDLQKYFLEKPDLPTISDCDPTFMKNMLLKIKVQQPIILVDNVDFLLNTWDKDEKKELFGWLNRTLRSPAMTEKTFGIILQDDPVLSSYSFDKNNYGEERSLPLNFFDAA